MKVHSFNINDAKKYGVESAVLLYNIRFWLDKNLANNKNIHDGRVWTYNTSLAFSELFPYLTEKQIYLRLQKLEEKGILVTGTFNKNPWDRTKWYSVNEDRYSNIDPELQERDIHIPNMENGSSEKGISEFRKGNMFITDSNTDNKPDSNKDVAEKRKRFKKPTMKEVSDYFYEYSGSRLEAQRFHDFYESKDWYVGKNKMKNWMAAVRNWVSRNKKINNNERKPNAKKIAEQSQKMLRQLRLLHDSKP